MQNPARKASLLTLATALLAAAALSAQPKPEAPTPVIDCAFQAVRAVAPPLYRVSLLGGIARAYTKVGKPEKGRDALKAAFQLVEGHPTEDVFVAELAFEFKQNCQWECAWLAASNLTREREKLLLLPDIARGLARHGHSSSAREALAALEKETAQIVAPLAKNELLRDIAHTYGLLEDAATARKVLLESLEVVLADLTNFQKSALADTFAKCASLCSYEDILSVLAECSDPGTRVRALVFLADAYGRTDQKHKALKAVAEGEKCAEIITDVPQRAAVFALLAEACSRIGQREKVSPLLSRAQEATGKDSADDAFDEMWKTAAAAYAQMGLFADAKEAAERILRKPARSDALVRIAVHIADAGDLDAGAEMLSRSDGGPKTDSGWAELATRAAAKGLMEETCALVGRISRDPFRNMALRRIIRTLLDHQEYEEAREAVGMIAAAPVATLVAYRELIDRCVRQAPGPGADVALAQARLAASAIDNGADRQQALAKVAHAYARAGHLDEALHILGEATARPAGVAPTDKQKAAQAVVMVEAAALKAAHRMPDEACSDLTQALKLLEELNSARIRYRSTKRIVRRLAQEDLFEFAAAAAGTYKDPVDQAWSLLTIVDRQVGTGRPEPARALLRKALLLTANVNDLESQISLLAAIGGRSRAASFEPDAQGRETLRSIAQGAARTAEAARASNKTTHLAFFYSATCGQCRPARAAVKRLERAMPQLEVKWYDMSRQEARTLNAALSAILRLPESKSLRVPALFSSRGAIVGTKMRLEEAKELALAARGLRAPWEAVPKGLGAAKLHELYRGFSFLTIILAGLVDGINPCAFAVIIFFLSYLAYLRKTRTEILLVGIVFTVAVFLTYLAIGLGVASLIRRGQRQWEHLGQIVYVLTALLALGVAVISFIDGIRCVRGEPERVALKLPEKLKSRIRFTITRRARLGMTAASTFLLGAAVALLEFPCTGQVYVPTIMFALYTPGYRWGATGWLVIYNVCFTLPLVIIFLAVFFGLTSEKLTALFRRHMAATKFALAVVFLALFSVMIYSAFHQFP